MMISLRRVKWRVKRATATSVLCAALGHCLKSETATRAALIVKPTRVTLSQSEFGVAASLWAYQSFSAELSEDLIEDCASRRDKRNVTHHVHVRQDHPQELERYEFQQVVG